MKKFLAILAILPLTAIAQSTGTDVPSSTNTEIPAVQLPDLLRLPRSGGCGDYRNAVYIGQPRRSGTIYIIDDIVVETEETAIVEPLKPLQDMDGTCSFRLDRKDISTLPYTDLTDIVSLSPSVYQQQRGSANHISAGRAEEVLYVIDGMQIARK